MSSFVKRGVKCQKFIPAPRTVDNGIQLEIPTKATYLQTTLRLVKGDTNNKNHSGTKIKYKLNINGGPMIRKAPNDQKYIFLGKRNV